MIKYKTSQVNQICCSLAGTSYLSEYLYELLPIWTSKFRFKLSSWVAVREYPLSSELVNTLGRTSLCGGPRHAILRSHPAPAPRAAAPAAAPPPAGCRCLSCTPRTRPQPRPGPSASSWCKGSSVTTSIQWWIQNIWIKFTGAFKLS